MAVRKVITPHEVARRRLGLRVIDLAQLVGVSHSYVSRVESGEFAPSARYRQSVSEILGVRADILFPRDPSAESVPLL